MEKYTKLYAVLSSPLMSLSFNKYLANAGMSTIAPTIFQRNMKVSRNPISAWNLMGEKAQVATPTARVIPVKETALPLVFNVR